MRRASDITVMQPRRPYEYPIELRDNSFPHPRVKSFLLVISIGSIAGCGYFLAHSSTFQRMFEPEFVPPIAATLSRPPKKSGQNPATSLQNVKSADFSTPIAQNGAMIAAAAAVPSPHSVSRSADFSAPTAIGDTSAAVSYTSPDLAPGAHPVSYVAPPLGQVLGASTYDTDARFADLQAQIDALKNLPRSVFVPSFSGPAATTPVSTATFAQSQKIDQLSSTVTVGGSPIATAATVSDSLSNYLPLSGGTLTGGLDNTFTGTSTWDGNLHVKGQIKIGTNSAYISETGLQAGGSFNISTADEDSALVLQSLGRVGVSSSSPWGVLSVEHNGADASMPVMVVASSSEPNPFFLIDYLGRVGIGTSSPSDTFALNGAAYFADITAPSNTGNRLYSNAGSLYWAGNVIGGVTTGTWTSDGTNAWRAGGNVGIGTTTPWGRLSITGAGATSATYGLVVADSNDSPKMVVRNDGNVGIGTTTPATNLVVANRTATANITLDTAVSNAEANINFSQLGASRWQLDTGWESAGSDFYLYNYNLGSSALTADYATNNVTIPYASSTALTVSGNAYFPGSGIWKSSGNVGIGTTTPWSKLSIAALSSNTAPLFTISTSTASATSTAFIVDKNGLTGIASSSPWRTLSVAGTVGFDGLTAGAGAGALCLSANKEVTYSAGAGCTGSSQRFKHDIVSLDASSSLDTVLKLNPVSFVYNDDIGVKGPQVGLIAEEVQQVDPRLVATNPSGVPFTVKYENLTAILAAAIQNIFAQISDLANTIASFAERVVTKELVAVNVTGNTGTFNTLCVKKSDGTPTCITGDQFAALLSQSAAAAFANPTPAPTQSQFANPSPAAGTSPTDNQLANPTPDPDAASGTSDGTPSVPPTPPVIQINGENPAHIHIGDSYNDLGAPASRPQPRHSYIPQRHTRLRHRPRHFNHHDRHHRLRRDRPVRPHVYHHPHRHRRGHVRRDSNVDSAVGAASFVFVPL